MRSSLSIVAALIGGLLLSLTPTKAGTWAMVQHKSNASCTGTSCAVTVTSTGSNNLIVAIALMGATGHSITSITNGGTYTHCASCASSDTSAGATDASYTLASSSGATSITVNLNSDPGGWVAEIVEYSTTAGPPILDTQGTRDQSTAATSIAGVTLTPGGANDVIVQFAICQASCSGISGSYTNPADFPGNNGVAGWINTTDGTAPNWTSTSGRAALSALAFKETAAAGSTPGFNKRNKLNKLGMLGFFLGAH